MPAPSCDRRAGFFSLAEFDETLRLVLDSGGEFRMHPRGSSMSPLIRQGRDSVALVSPSKKLKKGGIVLYKRDSGAYVLHRIIGISKDGSLTMCGDRQTTPEPGICQSQVIALVCRIYRDGDPVELTNPLYRLYSFVWRSFAVRRICFGARKAQRKIFGKK